MTEEEKKEESLNIKQYENIKTNEEDEEKETNITNYNANDNEIFETKEKNNTRFKPKIKIDSKRQRYPYCIVWTPIPCFTWVFPSIGHAGICNSKGIIYDFAGPYCVSVDNMAFGKPTKYVLLDLNGREFDEYDKAIEEGMKDYNNKNYSFCFNNCHSYIAACLNKLKYKEKTKYTMIHVWWMLCLKGKYISLNKFIQTYLGFIVVVILSLGLYFLFRI